MKIKCLASIFLLVFFNLLIGINYLQGRGPFTLFNVNCTVLWNVNNSRRLQSTDNTNATVHVVFPHPYQYILINKEICSQDPDVQRNISLLILVCSSVANLEQRKTIRETWAYPATSQNNQGSVRLGFLIGATNDTTLQEKVRNESRIHSDMIQEDFHDSYKNLTLKSVMMLKWVSEYCRNVHFLLKTDDDMYVNIAKLLTTLEKASVKSKVMYGKLFRKSQPFRNPTSKYFVSKEQFGGDTYPDFFSGTGYVISGDVIPTLYEISFTVPFLPTEDVFVTGLCAIKAGVRRYDVKGFANWKRSPTGCAFIDAITGHRVGVPDMRKIWAELQNENLTCPALKNDS